jgi:predicted nucleic acid-binding protein
MLMSSKIFLDSSILVEKAKGTKEELFDYLIGDDSVEKCINSIVLSEFTYYFLAIEGNASPMSLKMRKAIQPILKKNSPKDLLKVFTYLRDDSSVISLYLTFMEKYNLLPNDALILANYKIHKILNIASYDVNDFKEVCESEGINLISKIKDLN